MLALPLAAARPARAQDQELDDHFEIWTLVVSQQRGREPVYAGMSTGLLSPPSVNAQPGSRSVSVEAAPARPGPWPAWEHLLRDRLRLDDEATQLTPPDDEDDA